MFNAPGREDFRGYIGFDFARREDVVDRAVEGGWEGEGEEKRGGGGGGEEGRDEAW